jgi:prepilin-type N-terminal cleavage/methylation domain-containing protein
MQRRVGRDDGFTTIEMVVALVVFGVFLSMFSGAIWGVYKSSNRTQAVVHTSEQISQAFLTLDREVRYASYIAAPGQVSSDANNWYVEFQDTTSATPLCYQLRISQSAGQLQQRTWTTGSPSAWQPLAGGVANGATAAGAAQPFITAAASASVKSAQLTLNLTDSEDATGEGTSTLSTFTFTALNSSLSSPTSGLCTGHRP